jgi:hypothetical protein
MGFVLTLPIPPSVNAAYGNRRAGKGAGEEGPWPVQDQGPQGVAGEADKWFLTQKRGLQVVTGPAMVCIKLPMKMRGDVSNRIKLAEDFLVTRCLTSDDSQSLFVGAVRSVDVPDGQCEIVVKPA